MRPVQILGVNVQGLRRDDLLDLIEAAIRARQKLRIMHVNAHAVNLGYGSASFRKALNGADVVFCDGFGVKLAARILGKGLPERFTPPDWIGLLCDRCVAVDAALYFLGARPGVAEKAAQVLQSAHPGLQISGVHHGYFDHHLTSQENRNVLEEINASQAEIVIVGFGMPMQELWVAENSEHLQAPVVLTAGAIFDYISGELNRPPHWMTDHGFEWLGRLLFEPRRLWKRYILGNPVFLLRVILQRMGLLRIDD